MDSSRAAKLRADPYAGTRKGVPYCVERPPRSCCRSYLGIGYLGRRQAHRPSGRGIDWNRSRRHRALPRAYPEGLDRGGHFARSWRSVHRHALRLPMGRGAIFRRSVCTISVPEPSVPRWLGRQADQGALGSGRSCAEHSLRSAQQQRTSPMQTSEYVRRPERDTKG
jgi:hypothetical protein